MRLIDADSLKAVLMETTCNPGTIGEVVAKIFCGVIDEQPEVMGFCKDCKHWKDSDGTYRRSSKAESKCPLNIKAVYDGVFCCGMWERRTNDQ